MNLSSEHDSCPSVEDLAACLRGDIDEQQQRSVLDHTAHCRACGELADTVLLREDPLFGPWAEIAATRRTLPQPTKNGNVESAASDFSSPPRLSGSAVIGFPDLPGYTILDHAGRGGMGDVWKAIDEQTAETVAVKITASHLAGDDAAGQHFLDECRALQQIESEHVVGFRAFGNHRDRHYLVMEWVEGRDLQSILDSGQVPTVTTLSDILRQVSLGLQAIHGSGLIHRDLKPANVLLDDTGHIRIVDFGLVREPSESTGQTDCRPVGTADYTAPELLDLKSNVSDAVDIYSLGCIGVAMTIGRAPLSHLTSDWQKCAAHTAGEVGAVLRHNTDLKFPLNGLLNRMVHCDPQCRPRLTEIISELSCMKLPHERSGTNFPAEAAEPKFIPAPIESTPYVRSAGDSAPRDRRKVAGYAVLTAIVALTLVASVQYFNREDPPPEQLGATIASVVNSDSQRPSADPLMLLDQLPPSRPAAQTAAGNLIAVPAEIPGIQHWQLVHRIPPTDCTHLDPSPSGSLIALVFESGELRVLPTDPAASQTVEVWPLTAAEAGSGVRSAWSPDERFLAVAPLFHNEVRIFDRTENRMAGCVRLGKWSMSHTASLEWSRDSTSLLIASTPPFPGGDPASVRILRLDSESGAMHPAFHRVLPSSSPLVAAGWHKDGSVLTAAQDGTIGRLREDSEIPEEQGAIPGQLTHFAFNAESGLCAAMVSADDSAERTLLLLDHDLNVIRRTAWSFEPPQKLSVLSNGEVCAGGISPSRWVDEPQAVVATTHDAERWAAGTQGDFFGWIPESGLVRLSRGNSSPDVILPRNLFAVCAVAGHPMNNAAAFGMSGGQIVVADFARNRVARMAEHRTEVGEISFSPDGTLLASCALWGDNRVIVQDPEKRRPTRVFRHDTSHVSSVDFHPTAPQLVSAGRDGCVRIWDLTENEDHLMFAEDDIAPTAVRFSHDGALLAIGYNSGELRIVSTAALTASGRIADMSEPLVTVQFSSSVDSLEWHPEERLLAVNALSEVSVINADANEVLFRVPPSHRAYDIAWSPRPERIEAGMLGILNAQNGELLRPHVARLVARLPGSSSMIRADASGRFDIVDPESEQTLRSWIPTPDGGVLVTPKGAFSHRLSDPGRSLLWSVETSDGTLHTLNEREFTKLLTASSSAVKPESID